MYLVCEVTLLFILAFSQAQIYFPTDEICKSKTGQKQCVHVNRCSNRTRKYQLEDYPKPCALQGEHPFVCCDTTDIKLPTGAKSTNKCNAWYNKLPLNEFGVPDYNAVVGIRENPREDYPYTAALGNEISPGNITWICAGALISENFVITAAHCLGNSNNTVNLIRLGDLDLNITSDPVETQTFKISKTFIHPEYKPPALYHDLALIQLDRPVKITKFVKPACILTNENLNIGFWETNGYSSLNASNYLYDVGVVEASNVTCNFYFGFAQFATSLPNNWDYETQLCANTLYSRDPCQNDTGGPLQTVHTDYTDGRFLIGVTIIEKPCGESNPPGLYIKILYYLDWIESIIWA